MGFSLRRFMRRFGKDAVEGTASDGTSWSSIVCMTQPEVWHRAPIRVTESVKVSVCGRTQKRMYSLHKGDKVLLCSVPEKLDPVYVFIVRETYQQRMEKAAALMSRR
jgi:hypothetical protein